MISYRFLQIKSCPNKAFLSTLKAKGIDVRPLRGASETRTEVLSKVGQKATRQPLEHQMIYSLDLCIHS